MKKLKANFVQIVEIIILIVAFILPYILDIPSWFSDYLSNHKPEPTAGSFIPYYILKTGNTAIALGLLVVAFWRIRKYNKDFVMNNDNVYHDYPFLWYWFSAKVLGIKKCNLIFVPIYMQFKLVVGNIFQEFPLDDADFPIIENEPSCTIVKKNMVTDLHEVNLILEDTYVIESKQIPARKKSLPTIKVSRNNNSHTRHFSPNFVDAITEELRNLPHVSVVNVYATTNPMNTLRIARAAFRMADRGNIDHVVVYQQNRSGIRKFAGKGYKVY